MIYLGIDPGHDGALAIIDDCAPAARWIPMPMVHAAKGKPQYDVKALHEFFAVVGRDVGSRGIYAACERLTALPPTMGGSSANYARGRSLGLLEALMVATHTPYALVQPKAWQKVMLAGTPGDDTKQRSILACQRLFPSVSLMRTERCRKPHDGAADALLIAEYGRRKLLSG